MTKEEAIKAMLNGEKVTHLYFTDDEYVFICDKVKNIYEFEDGVTLSAEEFWKYRMDDTYLIDWEIFKD